MDPAFNTGGRRAGNRRDELKKEAPPQRLMKPISKLTTNPRFFQAETQKHLMWPSNPSPHCGQPQESFFPSFPPYFLRQGLSVTWLIRLAGHWSPEICLSLTRWDCKQALYNQLCM